MKFSLSLLSLLLLASPSFADWHSSGPLGGAVNAVVVAPSDPAVIWAGSPAGVWRSSDGGATWASVNGPPDVAKLAVHPADPNTAWALSSTLGLYKTTDAGATWTSMNRFAGITPTALLVDRQNPDTLYVAGNCYAGIDVLFLPWNGVHQSTDGGATWKTLSTGSPLGVCAQELAVDPFSPWRLFAGGAYGGRAESYDRAQTWQAPGGARPTLGVIFDPRFPFTHYGVTTNSGTGSPAFLVSQDGGFSWSVSSAQLPDRPIALTMDPQRGRLFLATQNAMFRSGDGGRVWAKTSLQDVNVASIDFGGTPAAVFAATNQGLFQVAGRGAAESRPIDFHQIATYPWAMDIDPSDPNVLYASASDWASGLGSTARHGRVYRSLNGGASWERVPGDDDVERDRIAIDAGGTVYAAQNFRGTTLYRRKRGEEKWTPVLDFGFIYGLAADPKTPGTVFVAANGVLRSRDGGDTWQGTNVGANFLAIDPSDPRWVYGAGENHLYRSGDSGNAWADLQPPGFENGTRFLAVAPSKGTVLYRIGANGGRPRPERSDDRGDTWRAATLPGDATPTALAVDPRDENSVWAAVFPVALYSSRGLFHSADGGAHWTEVKGPFGEPVSATALRFDPSGRVLHVAYANHGVWELEIQ